jgi:hypothetical protein
MSLADLVTEDWCALHLALAFHRVVDASPLPKNLEYEANAYLHIPSLSADDGIVCSFLMVPGPRSEYGMLRLQSYKSIRKP